MGACCSCFGVKQPKARSKSANKRSGRQGSNQGNSKALVAGHHQSSAALDNGRSLTASLYSADDDFHSCQDAFSFGGSPLSTSPLRMSLDMGASAQQLGPHPVRASQHHRRSSLDTAFLSGRHFSAQNQSALPPLPSVTSDGSSYTPPGCLASGAQSQPHKEPSHRRARSGCLPEMIGQKLDALTSSLHLPQAPALLPGGGMTSTSNHDAARAQADGSAAAGRRSGVFTPPTPAQLRQRSAAEASTSGRRCDAGCTMQWRDPSTPEASASLCYEAADPMHYKVRGLDYATSRVKITSDDSLYELVATDTFSSETKQDHVAQLVNLPVVDEPVPGTTLPRLLIINIQIPTYAPSLWGRTDGPGCSIVFYFKLRPDFDPATFANQKALRLFERFVTDGREADGSPTRDRFKLIGRVVNVDEWAVKGPLSSAEHRLLTAYNEKPLLTRPQHRFYAGDNYLEVDIDIHSYTYIARAAFQAYVSRLGPVVWENAFVVQGNTNDELPELVLAAARVYRVDLTKLKPLVSSQS